jgi:hypothetical protein
MDFAVAAIATESRRPACPPMPFAAVLAYPSRVTDSATAFDNGSKGKLRHHDPCERLLGHLRAHGSHAI